MNVVTHEYPDHQWKSWKFPVSQKNWWTDVGKQFINHDIAVRHIAHDIVEELMAKYSITLPNEWESVKLTTTEYNQLSFLGGLPHVLANLYPHQFAASTTPDVHGSKSNLSSPRSRVAKIGVLSTDNPFVVKIGFITRLHRASIHDR